jgi:ABC-type sugar transport system permease subunit
MGYAAAMSIIFGIIVLGVTFIQYYLFTKEKKGGMKNVSPQ